MDPSALQTNTIPSRTHNQAYFFNRYTAMWPSRLTRQSPQSYFPPLDNISMNIKTTPRNLQENVTANSSLKSLDDAASKRFSVPSSYPATSRVVLPVSNFDCPVGSLMWFLSGNWMVIAWMTGLSLLVALTGPTKLTSAIVIKFYQWVDGLLMVDGTCWSFKTGWLDTSC